METLCAEAAEHGFSSSIPTESAKCDDVLNDADYLKVLANKEPDENLVTEFLNIVQSSLRSALNQTFSDVSLHVC